MNNEIVKQALQGNLDDIVQEYAASLVDEDEEILVPFHVTEECWFFMEGIIENWVEQNT